MKKSNSKFLKIVDEKHDINFHWPKYVIIILKVCASASSGNLRSVGMQLPENYQQKFDVSSEGPSRRISPCIFQVVSRISTNRSFA
jgi:hypothetical protein